MAAEKLFENKVKDYLKKESCYFIKYWGGGQFTKAGIPDVLCCCNGYFIGIELKSEKGTPSKLQIYNLEQINKSGGYAVLLYPSGFELFKGLISSLNNGFEKNAEYFYQELRKVQKK